MPCANGEVDLNRARQLLQVTFVFLCTSWKNDATGTVTQVPKRRVYDITNVLEGVGLLTQTRRNIMRWVSPQEKWTSPEETEDDEELLHMTDEVSVLRDARELLARRTEELTSCLVNMLNEPEIRSRLYVLPEDLENLVGEERRLFVIEAEQPVQLSLEDGQLVVGCCVPMAISLRKREQDHMSPQGDLSESQLIEMFQTDDEGVFDM